MDELRAVRVEVGDLGDGSLDTDASPSPVVKSSRWPGGWKANVGATAVVLALVLALLALRPSPGDTAAGTERGVSSTTTTSSSASEMVVGTTVRQSISGASSQNVDLWSMVRDDIGFFALGQGEGLSLHRSLRGLEWQEVEVQLSEAATPAPDSHAQYWQPLVTDDGLAVLRVQEDLTQFDRNLRIDRLTSADGLLWDIDEDFEPVIGTRGNGWGFLHFEDAIGFTTYIHSVDLAAVLGDALAEGSSVDVDGICWIEPAGEEELRAVSCDADPVQGFGTAITASDLSEPARFDQLSLCASAIWQEGRGVSRTVLRYDHSSFEITAESQPSDVVRLGDGRIAMLSPGNVLAESPDLSECDSFGGGLPSVPPPAIEIAATDAEMQRYEWPAAAAVVTNPRDDQWLWPTIRALESDVLLLVGRGVWRLDTVAGEWSRLVELPETQTNVFDYAFASDEQLVGVHGDDIVVADLVTGAVELFPLEVDVGGWARVVYADSDLFILKTESGKAAAIELPR